MPYHDKAIFCCHSFHLHTHTHTHTCMMYTIKYIIVIIWANIYQINWFKENKIFNNSPSLWAFFVAQLVKNPPAMQETWILSLGWEDPMEEERITHSSILAWRIPWTEYPGRLQSMASHDRTQLATNPSLTLFI